MFKANSLSCCANQFAKFLSLTENLAYKNNKPFSRFLNVFSEHNVYVNRSSTVKLFHTSRAVYLKNVKDKDIEDKSLLSFEEFDKAEKKNKQTFLEAIRIYEQNFGAKKGHVDFIKIALRNMKEFGVHQDIEMYKKILNILPKGPFISTNRILADSMYYPRQQMVAIELLDQLRLNKIIPDAELGVILENIFGMLSMPCKKYYNMVYWCVKLQNKSPWPLPRPVPDDAYLLGKMAIERITSVDIQTEISIFDSGDVPDSLDKTWIVSGQSPVQRELLAKHKPDTPVIVEGGDIVWLRDKPVAYFILKADTGPLPYTPPKDINDLSIMQSPYLNPNYGEEDEVTFSVHEQDDGIIYGVCATGTSTKDSLLSWIRLLQVNGNPILENLPVLFRFKTVEKSPALYSETLVVQEQ